MDLMKIIESLDEALYSVMSWLVFYPLTLWRTMIHPQQMMDYADREVSDQPGDQYDDTIRPPLFLFLTLLLSHGLEILVVGQNPLLADRHGLASLVDSDLALLGLRLLLFSLFPLMMAVRLLRRRRARLTHTTLRRPFYGQCFTTAPFSLLLGIATLAGHIRLSLSGLVGPAMIVLACGWYLGVQATWFSRKLQTSWAAGLGNALIAAGASTLTFLVAALLVI